MTLYLDSMEPIVKMKCPLCDKEVTKRNNLFTHLTGARRRDGHDLPDDEANKIVEAVFSGRHFGKNYWERNSLPDPDSLRTNPENGFESFLEDLFVTLVENKELPKYQFERRIDAILHLFLPDLLTSYFGNKVETLVPEFPLKKNHSWGSTNVDSLLYMWDGESDRIKYWLFLELKTDDGSVDEAQIDIYEKILERSMLSLIEDVKGIFGSPNASAKYNRLIERLSNIPLNDHPPIRFIYLVPTIPPQLHNPMPKSLDLPYIYPLTFAEIEHLPVKQYPEAWEMFRRIVIPFLRGRK